MHLRTEQPLNINATQRWRFNPPSVFLRTNVSHQMKCSGRMTVDVAIEAGDTSHTVGLLRLAICCRVELLLRKLCHQQAQTIELLRVENAIEQFVKIINRYDLPFRNIPEIGPSGQ